MSAPGAARPARPPLWRRGLRQLERSLAFAGALLIVYHAGFGVSEVVSGSMEPTLAGTAGCSSNDWILFERITSGPPPRGKLLVFESEDGLQVAKRVIAYGGERLRIVDHRCQVNGAPIALPAEAQGVRYLAAGNLRPVPDPARPFEVPPGTVYVLGDNARDSWDSRWTGGVPERRWTGRVVAIVWPPSRWSWKW